MLSAFKHERDLFALMRTCICDPVVPGCVQVLEHALCCLNMCPARRTRMASKNSNSKRNVAPNAVRDMEQRPDNRQVIEDSTGHRRSRVLEQGLWKHWRVNQRGLCKFLVRENLETELGDRHGHVKSNGPSNELLRNGHTKQEINLVAFTILDRKTFARLRERKRCTRSGEDTP